MMRWLRRNRHRKVKVVGTQDDLMKATIERVWETGKAATGKRNPDGTFEITTWDQTEPQDDWPSL